MPLRTWLAIALSVALTGGLSVRTGTEAMAASGPNSVSAVAVSPDGARMAVGGQDSRIFVYDQGSGRLVRTLDGQAGLSVTAVAFSPDGRLLASAGRDSTVRLWDASTGTLQRVLNGHDEAVRSVAFSTDGKTLVSGGEDTKVIQWDVATGRLRAVLPGTGDFVTAVAVSPDGKRFATAARDASIRIWGTSTRAPLATLRGQPGEVTSLAFAPDGASLASGSTNATVTVWDATKGAEVRTLRGHTGSVTSVAFGRAGADLASGSADGSVRIWDPKTGALRGKVGGTGAPVHAVAYSPDGNTLIQGRQNGVVQTWNVQSNTSSGSVTLPAPVTGPMARSAAPDSAAVPNAATAATTGPGGPVLVVTSSSDPFSSYYAEILRTEGLNAFATADVGTVSTSSLTAYDVVILAAGSLTSAQVGMFTSWVGSGGNLIAMRPDSQLAGLLGLTSASGTLADGYLRVDTSSAPGKGIVGGTIQFHGVADRYTLSGARSVATLYSTATAATANPAVTINDVGSNGGQAAAFTYDLARSVVYTRQGNPAWSGQERDGTSPIRSDDLYYGAAAGDTHADWVDLDKVAIPQADEQQRLLANMVESMNADRTPLPRFWYLPRELKAAVVMTGDDHGNGGTAGRFDEFAADSPAGCSVSDWECIRGTSYVYPSTPLTNSQAAAYTAQGFEVGVHVSTNCGDWTPSSLRSFYNDQLSQFASKYTGVPAPTTNRTHCIAWSDWSTQPAVELEHGIRLDTNYYYWPPSWVADRPGFFTGSGMPMRFADTTGSMVDVYQATSQMTDESGQTYPATIDSLLDAATGQQGYYGVFTINAHTDSASSAEATAVVNSAKAHGVPVVTAKQMLTWLDGRNASTFTNISWSAGRLSFTVTPGPGANNLDAMVPFTTTGGALTGVTHDGNPVAYTTKTVKGIPYAFVGASGGTYVATYQADTTKPTVTSTSPSGGATGVALNASVTSTFSEDIDPATVTSSTFELRTPTNAVVPAAVTYDAASRSAALAPSTSLAANTTYRVVLHGGGTEPTVKDLAGNPLAGDESWTFTTASGPTCPCSVWASSAEPVNKAENDPNAVELGVRFRSDVDGFISGIRFWKGAQNTGTHSGSLWTAGGTRLATAVFTGESASGWQQVSFASPVAVTAGTTYVASYHTSGNYAGDNGGFATSGVDNAPLHALRDGQDGANGVYAYGASSIFPSNSWLSSNYWVDVVFTTTPPADTTPPTVTSTSPVDGATGTQTATAVSAVFSEPLNPSTVTASTMTLTGLGGSGVQATVTYDAATKTATLTPAAPLASSTQYTARISGGANGVTDVAGNPLAQDKTWTFTTTAPPPAAPSGLSAVASASGVVLDWADSSDGAAGYAVYRGSSAAGPFTRLTPSVVSVSGWEDSSAPAGASFYRVTALSGSGAESGPSAVVSASMAKANRLVNPGFETDANGDGRPDSWTSSARFTSQAAAARSGSVGGRHTATNNAGYTVGETVTGLTAGSAYDFAGWVNIPATSDAFTFRFDIVWKNSSGTALSTQTVSTWSAATSGWVKAAGTFTAPAGATRATVNMVTTSLNATVYVDDLALR